MVDRDQLQAQGSDPWQLYKCSAVTPLDLRWVIGHLSGVASVELVDISFHGGRRYVTLQAAVVQRLVGLVQREFLM